jgi:hypothetical protein
VPVAMPTPAAVSASGMHPQSGTPANTASTRCDADRTSVITSGIMTLA